MIKDKQWALKKIEKLLRLSESPNANESAIALRQASALMEKYGISGIDVSLAAIKEYSIESKRKTIPFWERLLLNLISKYFGVAVLRAKTRFDQRIEFIGVNEKPMIAGYAFEFLSRSLKKARRTFLSNLPTEHPATRKKLADSFAEGWVSGVSGGVYEFLNGPSNEERKLIDEYNERKEVKRERSIKEKQYTSDEARAALHGVTEGQKVKINHGVGRAEPQLELS